MADELIFEGAEAEVRRAEYHGIPAVRKTRRPKAYRATELDQTIRRARLRDEALILSEASAAGVAVPRVLDVDLATTALLLERVEGPALRDAIESGSDAQPHVKGFGAALGRLHEAGLVHGDPTTSNVLATEHGPVLLDFGLAQRSREVEDRGVDLVLVQRTFEASHPGRLGLWAAFLEGYSSTFSQAADVVERAKAIRARGRYV